MSSEEDLPRLEAIDFGAIYRREMREQRLAPKPPSAWDGRASGYGCGPEAAPRGAGAGQGVGGYVQAFLSRLRLDEARSVLDVGCGPGTLALPIAMRVHEVLALDNSAGMLEELRRRAAEQGATNVKTVLRAWEDDWSDLLVADIAIASRSTLVDDLEAALHKLVAHARLQVCLSYPVGGSFVDPDILAVVGLNPPRVPDHFLLLGMLHRMGIVPTVELLHTPSRLAACTDFDTFANRLAWSTGPLEDAATARLRAWWLADTARAAKGGRPMRWALVHWNVDEGAGR